MQTTLKRLFDKSLQVGMAEHSKTALGNVSYIILIGLFGTKVLIIDGWGLTAVLDGKGRGGGVEACMLLSMVLLPVK